MGEGVERAGRSVQAEDVRMPNISAWKKDHCKYSPSSLVVHTYSECEATLITVSVYWGASARRIPLPAGEREREQPM